MMTTFVAGIDEAGRGPVVGDLFMALVVIDSGQEMFLKALGVKDSKKLSKSRREELFKSIVSVAEVVIVARIPPDAIDRENLNVLEAKTLCQLVIKANSITKLDKIYIDAFTHPDKIKEYISRCLDINKIDNIVVEHGADSLYTVVGAASIVAKVLRDRHIEILKKVYGDFGSGYPSDTRTIDWLKTFYRKHKILPPIVRRSWKTIENVLGTVDNLDRYVKDRKAKSI